MGGGSYSRCASLIRARRSRHDRATHARAQRPSAAPATTSTIHDRVYTHVLALPPASPAPARATSCSLAATHPRTWCFHWAAHNSRTHACTPCPVVHAHRRARTSPRLAMSSLAPTASTRRVHTSTLGWSTGTLAGQCPCSPHCRCSMTKHAPPSGASQSS